MDEAPGVGESPGNLRRCYRALVDLGVIAAAELPLLDAWLADLSQAQTDARAESAR